MRLSNESDQALVRAAVSEAAANLLSFVPSLGTREVFTFGTGIALPTCMRFQELPPELRPNSDASGHTHPGVRADFGRDLVESVIGRWRSATMGYRISEEDMQEAGLSSDGAVLAPPVAPGPRLQTVPPKTPVRLEGLRSNILKTPS